MGCEIMAQALKFRNNLDRPNLLYKYKSISSIDDLLRLYDTLKNCRIYLPVYDQLNDPLEGSALGHVLNEEHFPHSNPETDDFEVEDEVVFEAHVNDLLTDQEDSYIRERKKHYRILSLSSEPRSHQLWAHYAENHKGICLCFKTSNSLSSACELKYIPVKENLEVFDEIITNTKESVELDVIRNWLYKQEGWAYEKEWRMIFYSEPEEKAYLNFSPDELVAVILGEKVSKDLEDIVRSWIPENTKLLRTIVGQRSHRIYITSAEFKREDALKERTIPDLNLEKLLAEHVTV